MNHSLKETLSLSSKQIVGKNSTILSLTPFSGKSNYLCVGGRLKHADIPTNSRKQVPLSRDHFLCRLFTKEIYE